MYSKIAISFVAVNAIKGAAPNRDRSKLNVTSDYVLCVMNIHDAHLISVIETPN